MFNIFEPINIFESLRKSDDNSKDAQKIMGYLSKINEPNFYIKEVGISSKLIKDWIKATIVDEVIEKDNEGWRKFSLAEAIWLKFVEELRYFGVGLPELAQYKKRLFEIDINFFKAQKEAFQKNKGKNDLFLKLSKYYEGIFANGDEEALRQLKLFQPTSFAVTLLLVMAQKMDIAFVFNQQMCGFIELSGTFRKEFPDEQETVNELQKHLSNHSFTIINFKSLLTRFFDNEKVAPSEAFYLGIMSEKERDLLERVKSDNYSKITVTLASGQIILTRATKKNNDKLMKQLARLMKKGDFLQVEFVTRDGSIVKYDETEIIK